ncbi:hypothetical protein, partial [Streptomyces sp. NPDC048611]|uniref:hypothetical protein n=1 Tax=Streptomyces sp. NPDC048611 TaxID=3155635 RepID=UPI0034194DE5
MGNPNRWRSQLFSFDAQPDYEFCASNRSQLPGFRTVHVFETESKSSASRLVARRITWSSARLATAKVDARDAGRTPPVPEMTFSLPNEEVRVAAARPDAA